MGRIHKNQQQIEEELQGIGGTLSAKAMREAFVFYGIAPSHNACKLTELLLDVAINGVIHNAAIELAKSRIFQELSKIESNPEQIVMDYLPSIAYQDTILSKSVFPRSHIIKNFQTEHLVNFKKHVFKPCFMTIISSGAIFLKELQTIIHKCVDECSTKRQTLTDDHESFSSLNQLRFSGAELRLRDDNEELGYVAIGFEGPTFSQCTDRYALQVAKEIVGSWDVTYGGANHNAPYLAHSAFNSNICYLYKSFMLDYGYTSIWGCYFVCDKLKLDDMVCMLLSEWRRLCTISTDVEVERAVNQCVFHELTKLNNPMDRFFDMVNCFYLYNRYIPMKERFANYQEVTAETVRNIASKYIYDQSPAVVGLGRIENLTDYCIIHRGTYSLCY
ncbi:PREDICTED: cytochrome b-c1 complex subunit 1, mitochondrial-like isoform X2 [Vollenhovia emeryi]|uniref:cytochrome b-c1 complex subunit 1, mitochondrial-like isoform X2 n=1 Tax=Vollenhovia emeryi TaxID=411798 RepID=UPI0005F3DE81|nr:PREDICTED: cytochrome b-c1 complex subunit 1, mitochondrial-like isoform X2 [Vollenhovia emeryi]